MIDSANFHSDKLYHAAILHNKLDDLKWDFSILELHLTKRATWEYNLLDNGVSSSYRDKHAAIDAYI